MQGVGLVHSVNVFDVKYLLIHYSMVCLFNSAAKYQERLMVINNFKNHIFLLLSRFILKNI